MPSFIAFNAWGKRYSPKKVPLRHLFSQEPGEPLSTGPKKGQPASIGSSTYSVTDFVPEKKKRVYLFRKIYPLLAQFRKAGATDWYISIDRAYHAQCNDAFTQEEMKMFLKLKAEVWYTAFEVSAEEEAEMFAKQRTTKRKANKRPDGTSAKAPPSNPSQGAAVPHP